MVYLGSWQFIVPPHAICVCATGDCTVRYIVKTFELHNVSEDLAQVSSVVGRSPQGTSSYHFFFGSHQMLQYRLLEYAMRLVCH